MKKLNTMNFEDEEIKSYVHQHALIINIKNNAFEIATNIVESNILFDLFELAVKTDKIKLVFIYNEPECMGEEEYEKYLKGIYGEDFSTKLHIKNSEAQHVRLRQINILNHFILELTKLSKIVVMGLQGCVVTPFFGLSLAADLRLVSDNFRVLFSHIKYGIHPSGALPYFLPKYIGLNHTQELLYMGGGVSAEKAKDLGLVNQIFPEKDFHRLCLDEIDILSHRHPNLIRSTKLLLNINIADLEKYFEHEAKFVLL